MARIFVEAWPFLPTLWAIVGAMEAAYCELNELPIPSSAKGASATQGATA